MNDRDAERLIDALRDINTTLRYVIVRYIQHNVMRKINTTKCNGQLSMQQSK